MKDNSSLIAEIETNTTLSAFLGTVALFFTGILISQIRSFDDTIKVPILFLIISTFSFIFSASIYANASGELARHDAKKTHHYMAIANVVSEFLGMHLFVLSIPLALNAITHDSFLRQSVVSVAILGLVLYSLSPFSILHREVTKPVKLLLTIAFGGLGLLVYLSQTGIITGFTGFATALLAFAILLSAYFCLNTNQLKNL